MSVQRMLTSVSTRMANLMPVLTSHQQKQPNQVRSNPFSSFPRRASVHLMPSKILLGWFLQDQMIHYSSGMTNTDLSGPWSNQRPSTALTQSSKPGAGAPPLDTHSELEEPPSTSPRRSAQRSYGLLDNGSPWPTKCTLEPLSKLPPAIWRACWLQPRSKLPLSWLGEHHRSCCSSVRCLWVSSSIFALHSKQANLILLPNLHSM